MLPIVVLVIACAWGIAVLAWRRSPEFRALHAATAAISQFGHDVDAVCATPDRARRACDDEIKAYVEAQRSAARATVRLEDLREYGAKNIRWGGLSAVGVRTLDDLRRVSAAQLQSLPGIGATSAERIVAAARSAADAVERGSVPLPGRSLGRPRSMELVTSVGASIDAQKLLEDLPQRLQAQSREVLTRSHQLGRRATVFRWIFANKERREEGSILHDATELLHDVKERQEGRDLVEAKRRVKQWEDQWRTGADALTRARSSYPSLEAQIRDAVASVAPVADALAVPIVVSRAPVRVEVNPRVDEPASYRADATGEYRPVRVTDWTGVLAPQESTAIVDGRWVPQGETVQILGYTIPGGLIYVGDRIAPIARAGMDDPALIHPSLPVDRSVPDRAGQQMSYWPWYSRIAPSSRAAYLEWLQGGRRDPDAYIGYVFLFFYGLERRLLCDADRDPTARTETATIVAEVERLLGIYGNNGSFRGYAAGFLDALRARHVGDGPLADEPPSASSGASLQLRVGLGRFVAADQPIPANWSLAWLKSDSRAPLRGPASRCPEEFSRLFQSRFSARFPDGMRVARNRTPLVLRYQPASAAFQGPIAVPVSDLPDVTALSSPLQRLRDIAEECCTSLEPYSRWLARHPDDRESPAAVATLPAEISTLVGGERVRNISAWIEQTISGNLVAEVSAADLIELWSGSRQHRLARNEAVLVAQFLERRGCGIEPDVRFGGEVMEPTGKAVLFRLFGPGPVAASGAYTAAAILLRLGCVIAGSDASIADAERTFLFERVQSAMDLSPAERQRLDAHVRWLLAARVGPAGLKRLVGALDHAQRLQLADFAVGVAAADGKIEPHEVKALQSVFGVLGLDPSEVYTKLHNVGIGDDASQAPRSSRPHAAEAIASASSGGSPTPKKSATTSSVMLDPARVRARLAESEAVFGVLKDIFAEREADAPSPPERSAAAGIWGLDAAHSALVRELVGRRTWSRSEYEDVAQRLRLMPGGALETLNEAAYEATGEAFVEGDDTLDVRLDLLSETVA